MGMRWFRIRPVDVLFFRRPGPFSAGNVFRAETVLPTGLPFVGAFRAEAARVLGINPEALAWGHEMLGGPEDLGRLSFAGPFFEKDEEVLYPRPRILLAEGGAQTGLPERVFLNFPRALFPGIRTNLPPGFGMWRDPERKTVREIDREFVREGFLRKILERGSGEPEEGDLLSNDEVFSLEERVGIRLAPGRRTVEEGFFYEVRMLRLKPGVSFVLGVSGLPEGFPERGVLKLGGEGRLAFYEEREAPELFLSPPRPEEFEGETRLLVVLLTPGVFREGVRPAIFDEEWRFCVGGVRGGVVGVVTGKPLAVAGFDLARRRPRPMVRAVVAGAVFALKLEKPLEREEARELLRELWARPLEEGKVAGYPYGRAGFGLVVCGKPFREALI